MATQPTVPAANPATTQPALRRCIASPTFGIEAHEAPVAAFPTQPIQRDGLGRMCKPHWNEYTAALRRTARARTAAAAPAAPTSEMTGAEPAVSTRKRRTAKPATRKATIAKFVERTSDAPVAEALRIVTLIAHAGAVGRSRRPR